jgi:hypothetical protein
MNPFGLTDKEKKEIREKHEFLEKENRRKKEEMKNGIALTKNKKTDKN